jgi:MerR family transcriptional regulator, light-induced transcriptional regulator
MEEFHGHSSDVPQAATRALRRAYSQALLAGDEVAAEVTVREAVDAGLSTAEIDDAIITPAMWLVGELWARGEIGVGEEHVATEITMRVLTLQRELRRTTARRGGRVVVLAAPPGQCHVSRCTWRRGCSSRRATTVRPLGADVPIDAIADAAGRHAADVICLTATMTLSATLLPPAIAAVQRTRPSCAVLLGGAALPEEMALAGHVVACARVSGAVETADALVQRARLN